MRIRPLHLTRRAILFVALSLLLLPLAGCDPQAMMDLSAPQEGKPRRRNALWRWWRSWDFDTFQVQAVPSLRTPDTRAQFEKVADLFPPGEPLSIHVVGAASNYVSGTTTYDLSFEYAYPGKWLLANVVLQRHDGRLEIFGLHVRALSKPLAELNKFAFAGMGLGHYLMFAMALLIPLFIIFALIVCIRTPMARRKWLWIVFIVLGVAGLSFNWTTGAVDFQLLHLQLGGAGYMRQGLVGPWVITLSVPLGATLFLIRRSRSDVARDDFPDNGIPTNVQASFANPICCIRIQIFRVRNAMVHVASSPGSGRTCPNSIIARGGSSER